MLLDALMRMDADQLRALAAAAAARFAGMEPGRPVGGAYYLYRTLRQLDADGLVTKMMAQAEQDQIGEGAFDERLAREEFEGRLKVLKEMIEAEIRRRLVADRGVEAMARTLRKPLPEDVDFMHASREEMQQLQKAIYPLTRALAARLAQRRKNRHRGTLDFRQTVRHSMSYGGVPAEPKFKRPRPSKPEIMVVADISGSVASFARFTLQFVYAMQSEFSKVRSWVFIDGVDEVTHFFDESDELSAAIQRVNTEADVVWVDGHSDYGHAFEVWHERHIREVTRKSSIILLGDARQQLPRVAGVDARGDAQEGAAAVLARPRAARLLGHRRLDRLGVRALLRRRVRGPQPPPAPEVRRRRRRSLTGCRARRSLTACDGTRPARAVRLERRGAAAATDASADHPDAIPGVSPGRQAAGERAHRGRHVRAARPAPNRSPPATGCCSARATKWPESSRSCRAIPRSCAATRWTGPRATRRWSPPTSTPCS